MKTVGQYSILVCMLFVGTACSQSTQFGVGNNQSTKSVDSGSCSTTTTSVPTKVIFMVDMSGSNYDGPYEHPGMATDPQKAFRYGALNTFFQEHRSSSWLSWSFMAFSGSSARAFINSGSDQHPIFSDATAMGFALQTFAVGTDDGATPYKAALAMLKNSIQQDKLTAAPGTQYRIAFLTDGYPTDYCPSGASASACPVAVMDAEIMSDVQSVVNANPGAVQFSTVYYGLPDGDANARLHNMAAAGGGQFVDASVVRNLKLDDVISVPCSH